MRRSSLLLMTALAAAFGGGLLTAAWAQLPGIPRSIEVLPRQQLWLICVTEQRTPRQNVAIRTTLMDYMGGKAAAVGCPE